MNGPTGGLDSQGVARQALAQAVRDHGPAILANPHQLGNVLNRLLPTAPEETSVLVAAARAETSSLLAQRVTTAGPDAAVQAVAGSLAQRGVLDPHASLWAAGEFARALGYPVSDWSPTLPDAGMGFAPPAPGTGFPPPPPRVDFVPPPPPPSGFPAVPAASRPRPPASRARPVDSRPRPAGSRRRPRRRDSRPRRLPRASPAGPRPASRPPARHRPRARACPVGRHPPGRRLHPHLAGAAEA